MSCKTPPNSRVKTITNRFENLKTIQHLDHLDIPTSSLNSNIIHQPQKSFIFKRAATTFDLLTTKPGTEVINNKINKSIDIRNNKNVNDILRQTSDSFLFKHTQLHQQKKKENRENDDAPDIKLSRHTSDPVKRGSIKRSPAFRCGEKSNKTILTKHSPVLPKEFLDNRFEKMIKNKVQHSDKLQQIGLTDTLKAALKQPLPPGPPPKKPPRTFESPVKEIPHLSVDEKLKEKEKFDTQEIKSKINFLETNLTLKALQYDEKTHLIKTRKVSKENVVPASVNKILDCINCTSMNSPTYDTVVAFSNTDYKNKEKILLDEFLKKLPVPSDNPSEHIYMEPFSHLKTNGKNLINVPDVILNTVHINDNHSNNKMNNNHDKLCNCPQRHAGDSKDLHYMCTNVSEQICRTNDLNINEHDHNNLSLGNTYDEINMLVNAAFNEKTRDSGNFSIHTTSTENDNDVPENNKEILPIPIKTMSPTSSNSNRQSIKVSRSLTEKRKDYVRRISTTATNNLDNVRNYGTLHKPVKVPVLKTFSFESDDKDTDKTQNGNKEKLYDKNNKEIETTSERINKYKQLIEANNNNPAVVYRKNVNNNTKIHQLKAHHASESQHDNKNDQMDIEFDNETDDEQDYISTPNLFHVCLLIGFNLSTNLPYIKMKYPPKEDTPRNIEYLIFPSKDLTQQTKDNQDYSLILTDDYGVRLYGYCRRVLPESCEICLPLAYCLISSIKAPGFYFKVLKEIESRHGQTDFQTNFLLKNIQKSIIPEAGKFLHLKLPTSPRPKSIAVVHTNNTHKISPKRMSLEVNPKWLTESATMCMDSALQDIVEEEKNNSKKTNVMKSLVQEFEEKKSQPHDKPPFDLSLINRSLTNGLGASNDEILIRRPNDLRLESTELSDLFENLGAELLITVFATLLLERKVLMYSKNISLLSSCVLGLQTLLYPFQWQYSLVTILPEDLLEICQAPFPVLAGTLHVIQNEIEDGIIINLDKKQMTQKCGDENTILPSQLRSSLLVSLQMVDLLDQGKMLSSVLIAEAFLRFFVELFGSLKANLYDKEKFLNSHECPSIRFFLEWFLETSMFRHFRNTKLEIIEKNNVNNNNNNNNNQINELINFYALFDARIIEKSENKNKTGQSIDVIMKNCRIINKKAKTFRDRFKDLF